MNYRDLAFRADTVEGICTVAGRAVGTCKFPTEA